MNNHPWPQVPLGELLKRTSETIELVPDEIYKEVTIRLWGKGVTVRRQVSGAEIGSGRRFLVKQGQFILSRIDARNGAMGMVPSELDGAVVTNDFPSFETQETRLEPAFLGWLSQTKRFVELCSSVSEGTTNRVRLKEERFFKVAIPLPPLVIQGRIVSQIESLITKTNEVKLLHDEVEKEFMALTRSKFSQIVAGARFEKMEDVAPLVRRKAFIELGAEFPELGVRCFGKGTFHKPTLDFLSVGTKKLYSIEPGDLVFSNVFAWEGAIAVAQADDNGRFGSHRFITCVPKQGVAIAEFLCFYFLTPQGMEQIGEASPGGAGRNRTLGLKKLADMLVPIPSYERQLEFCKLLEKVKTIRTQKVASRRKLNALLPSILDRAFKGEL